MRLEGSPSLLQCVYNVGHNLLTIAAFDEILAG